MGLNFRGWHGGRDNSFSSSPDRADQFLGPPSLLLSEYWLLFHRHRAVARVVDHSPASSAEAKTLRSCTSTPAM